MQNKTESQRLARSPLFAYALAVKKLVTPRRDFFLRNLYTRTLLVALAWLFAWGGLASRAVPQQKTPEVTPTVTKVDPPNWWVGLTPEVMLLVSGRDLEATHVACNMPTLRVTRTQASAGGNYLFVWLKIGADTRLGTAVCRITSPKGVTSFELPLASRAPTLGKFQGLSQDDVMYLIMPDRFANGDPTNDEPAEAPGSHDRSKARAYHGGDLLGIKNHLPYLKELGVTTLWLTPVVKNGAAQDYHGYGAVDLYAVDPHLGSLKDYQDLVAAAHKEGMKIFFDTVPNHVGPRHPWVSNPPLPDWFHGTLQHHLNSSSPPKGTFYGKPEQGGNDPFESLIDPHAPTWMKRNLTEGWFAGILPDMNTENPLVEEYLLQNSIWWAEVSGLDGYRVDTFPYVGRKFWAYWHAGLRRIYPNLTTIGEVFHPDPSVTSFFVGGVRRYDGIDSGLSTVFDFPMFSTLRDVLLKNAPVGRIADVLRHDALYTRPDFLVPFFANHDVTRFASAEGSSAAKLKLAFGLTLTLRGIPEIYYGDEIGMPGGGDPDNRRDFPGGWIGDSNEAFTPAGRTREQQDIFSSVQTLLRIRREHPALRGGQLWHLASDETAYVFLRESEEERVVVAFNNADRARELRIPLNGTPIQKGEQLLDLLGGATAEVAAGEIHISMPAQSLSIFSVN
ncbi:MAG TPA: alpha-amylase family glycosyl hydrolase [Candidatus Acidoferrum sp.]|nr:alpha-amylase family glycosyl hydrolase [Candidatus Acidoferrum sp.]